MQDVAEAAVQAASLGKNGERYILGNKDYVSSTDVIAIARKHFPNIRNLAPTPKEILLK